MFHVLLAPFFNVPSGRKTVVLPIARESRENMAIGWALSEQMVGEVAFGTGPTCCDVPEMAPETRRENVFSWFKTASGFVHTVPHVQIVAD